MYIENLDILNFRNINNSKVNLNKRINIILGKNAQGKTNFIESIYLTSFLKSFRTQKNSDLIKSGEEKSKINLSVKTNKVTNKIFLEILKNNKKLKVNDKKPSDYKYLNLIIFHPDEINYITSYPLFRRNLIDRSIFYIENNYIDLYRKYFRCLKQRNYLIKNKNEESIYWKEQLINYGSKIIRKRLDYIKKINIFFESNNFKKVNCENYSLQYSKKFENISIEDFLEKEFERKADREKQVGYTLVGPHRDDIIFYLNGHSAESFASQGQKRSLLISFKTAQILDYKSVQGHYPVLILDDMTSELDIDRKSILLENLLENSGQVFITSTDFKMTNFSNQTSLFNVSNGSIRATD